MKATLCTVTLILIVGYFTILNTRKENLPNSVKPKEHAGSAVSAGNTRSTDLAVNDLKNKRMQGIKLHNGFWDPEQVRRILDSRPSSARLLVAGFLLSNDPAFLQEAMIKFPDHPLAFLQYGAVNRVNLEGRLIALQKLSAIEPKNSLANFLKAAALAQENRNDEAISELSEGYKKSEFDTHATDAISSVREMALAMGLSPEDSAARALMSADANEVYTRHVELMKSLPTIAKDGGADLIASLGASAGIRMAQKNLSPLDATRAYQMEFAALSLVPPDTEYGDTGVSVKERLADLDAKLDSLEEANKKIKVIYDRSDPLTKQLYMENYLSRGGFEANRLLLEQKN